MRRESLFVFAIFCTCGIICELPHAILAQLVEQHTRNVQVVGSNPTDGSCKSIFMREVIEKCDAIKNKLLQLQDSL